VRKLIHSRVDPNGPTKHKRRTPLMLAAIHNEYLMVKFLLENDASHQLVDTEGKTALAHALEANADPRLIKLLTK
jgi:ankyrin repeat protein